MKNKRVTAVFLSIILTISTCMFTGGINVRAAENADAGGTGAEVFPGEITEAAAENPAGAAAQSITELSVGETSEIAAEEMAVDDADALSGEAAGNQADGLTGEAAEDEYESLNGETIGDNSDDFSESSSGEITEDITDETYGDETESLVGPGTAADAATSSVEVSDPVEEAAGDAATEAQTGQEEKTASGSSAETDAVSDVEAQTGQAEETASGSSAETDAVSDVEAQTGQTEESASEPSAETDAVSDVETQTGQAEETASGSSAETDAVSDVESQTGQAEETASGSSAAADAVSDVESQTGQTEESVSEPAAETTDDTVEITQNAAFFKISPGDSITMQVYLEGISASQIIFVWSCFSKVTFQHEDLNNGTDSLTVIPKESCIYSCSVYKQAGEYDTDYLCGAQFVVEVDDEWIVYPEGVHKDSNGIMPTEITILPKSPTESLTLKAVVSPAGRENLTYGWSRNGNPVENETDTLTMNPFQAGTYECWVMDEYGNEHAATFHVKYDTELILLPEGSKTVDGVREHIVDIKTQADVPTTLNTELYVNEGVDVTYQWYVWYPESGWFLLDGKTESSLVLPGYVDYGCTDRYWCKATDEYGNSDGAYYHLSAFVNSITSPNGYLQYVDGNIYSIKLPINSVGGEYEPITFKVDVDADENSDSGSSDYFELAYSFYSFTDKEGYISASGPTATIYRPCKYTCYIRDKSELYNDRVAVIMIDVYDPEELKVYPEGAETVDGVKQNTVTVTVEPGESVTLTTETEEDASQLLYWWKDPDGDVISIAQSSSEYKITPNYSGLYQCMVDSPDYREKTLYFYVVIHNEFEVRPAGYDTDSANYDAQTNCMTLPPDSDWTYELSASVTGGNACGVTYDWKSHDADDTNLETGWKTVPGGTAASITVTPLIDTLYECEITDEYKNTKTVSYLVRVPEKTDLAEAAVSLSCSSYTYNGETQKPSVTVQYNDVTLTEGTDYTVTYSPADLAGAGTKTVIVTAAEDSIYTGSVSTDYVIEKSSQDITANCAVSSLSVGGSTTVSLTGNKGTKSFKSSDTTVATVTSAGKVTAKKVGTVRITATSAATANYNAASKTITLTVVKAAQSLTVKASASSIAVGKTATISVTGARGTKTYKSSNTAIATVTSAGKVTAKKVGTVKITATSAATSNYKAASATVTIKVVPAATAKITTANLATGIKVTWSKVTGANGYLLYRNGTKIATLSGNTKVTYTDKKANTNGTKYTYKVVAKATTGTSKLSKSLAVYRVARPTVSSVTNSASKKMTVKWGKNAKATGYQIQYSTSKTFSSGSKTVTAKGAATVSKVIGSLTKGKTYYVRVRTYKTAGGKNFWSAWSAAKSVKITK